MTRKRPLKVSGIVEHLLARFCIAADEARPEGDGLVRLACEGVEVAAEELLRLLVGLAAASGQQFAHQRELGEDQVHDLRRAHLEGALAQEVIKRRGCLVAGDLQDTLVHGEHDQARGP